MKGLFIASLLSLLGCGAPEQPLEGRFICITDQTKKTTNSYFELTVAKAFLPGAPPYRQFEFKGKNTVVISAPGLEYITTYRIDGDMIVVEGKDQSDLILRIINKDLLVGEGYAQGQYRKRNRNDNNTHVALSILFLRKEPYEKSEIIGSIPIGNTFSVLESKKGIRRISSFGYEGYIIQGRFLKLTDIFPTDLAIERTSNYIIQTPPKPKVVFNDHGDRETYYSGNK